MRWIGYGKPIELDELRFILKRALHVRSIELDEEWCPPRASATPAVGESEPMRKVFALVQRRGADRRDGAG